VHDADLGRLRLQAETGQQARQALQRLLGLAAGPAQDDQIIGLCRLPDYAERDVKVLVRVLCSGVSAA
jgi:hypothetical protein